MVSEAEWMGVRAAYRAQGAGKHAGLSKNLERS